MAPRYSASQIRSRLRQAQQNNNGRSLKSMTRFDATTMASEQQSIDTIRLSVLTTSGSERTGGDWRVNWPV